MSADQFREFAAGLGYELPQNIEPGRRFRFSVNGKRSDDAGWGILFADGEGGVIGDWRTDAKHCWQARRDRKLTAEELQTWQSKIEREKREAEADRARDADEAAARAAQIWESSEDAPADHPYLAAKRVGANGAVVYHGPKLAIRDMDCGGALILPLRNAAGAIRSLEFIRSDGEKRFLPGGGYQGCYFGIPGNPAPAQLLCIAEGFATAASIAEATGYSAVAAMTAGNLEPAARALRVKYPQARIIICADDDYRTKGNPGLTKAREAARAIGALVAVPDFGTDRYDGATDFNDLSIAKGLEAVKAALEAAVLPDAGTHAADAPARAVEAPKAPEASRAAVPPVAPNGNVEPGAELLDAVHGFLGRFVAYPSEHAQIAHALWIAHAHLMDAWESTPRIAFLSPEPGSGKTRALELTETLVPRPVESVNATSAYLFRKISDEDGPPTLLYDEIDTVFGPKAKDNEDIRGILNAGHRRGATAGRCVVHGKTISTEELPAYCAVAMAGLGALPDTILTRSVIVRMRRRAPSEVVEPYRRRIHAPQGNAFRDRLANWARVVVGSLGGAWPEMPPGIADRDADVWEALLAIADTAGGMWPARAREAAVALVADGKRSTPSLGVRLLADLRAVFGERAAMPTEDIIKALVSIDEAPWADLRGKPVDARRLAGYLRPYGVSSRNIRADSGVVKGYAREDLHDPWTRYLGLASGPDKSATSATNATDGGREVIE